MKKHSKQSRISIRRVLCVSILIVGISILSSIRLNATTISDNLSTYSSLTPHDSISIYSNYGFTVFPGSGTEEDPYIIEGYIIRTTSDRGIYVTDTTEYFIVRNCYVDAKYYGIYITDVADGTATIINNTCSNNGIFSIFFRSSGSSTVANNTSTNCGLYIREDNIDGYLSYTVENNWVNEKKIGFYTNLDSTIIDEPVYGQLILVNCTNVTVRDQILDSAGIDLSLRSCTSSVIINNTCNNNYYYGILIDSSSNSTVANNTCNNNNNKGIDLRSSSSSTVESNTCNNNYYGIYLDSSSSFTVINNTCSNNYWAGIHLQSSVDSTITNNTCSNNNGGINLRDSGSSNVESNTCNNNRVGISFYNSGSSTVANNTCSNNIWDGINLVSSGSSTVANNTCSNNNDYGISLSSSAFCVVTYNLLQENIKYGVYLGFGSDNNLIHHNNIVYTNLGGTSQAFDNGINNTWYDPATLEGNYWSNWSGTGSYAIDGTASSEDFYPLKKPAEYSTDETQIYFTFTLLIVVVPLLLTKLFSRKNDKKLKR